MKNPLSQWAARRGAVGDARDILVELGRRKVGGGQEDMIVEVAMMLAEKQKQSALS